MNSPARDIALAIDKAQCIAISAHVGPDGDAIGSTIALAGILGQMGKKVQAFIPKEELGSYSILRGAEKLLGHQDAPGADLIVLLDTATEQRIGNHFLRERIGKTPSVNIDHHETNPGYGTLNYILPDASSTGEVLWTLANELGWEIDTTGAEALWTAVVTDTGRFSYDMTSPLTLRMAASLLEKGVRHDLLNDAYFSKSPLRAVRLKAVAYANVETWFGGKAAVSRLDAEDYARLGATKTDSDNFVDVPKQVDGALLAILFYRSGENDKTHLSIRSREPVSAAEVAALFGGGGHKMAAGATLDMPLKEAMEYAKGKIAALGL